MASLMLCRLICQDEEGEKPHLLFPPPPPNYGFGESSLFRSNCPSTEKLEEGIWDDIQGLGEVAVSRPGLPHSWTDESQTLERKGPSEEPSTSTSTQ